MKSLLPGPVNIHPDVLNSFSADPISHRSESFITAFERTRSLLRTLVPSMDVAIFPGGGTLANDAIAANIKALFGLEKGLVISNGEFGERLAKHAASAALQFEHLQFDWGSEWNLDLVAKSLEAKPTWLWAVHLETSTGVLNELAPLLSLAQPNGVFVALDCVSSLGAVSIPSSTGDIHLASSVSGKSLGSYAGLAFVYASEEFKRQIKYRELCSSFNLLRMMEACGTINTVSSPPLLALLRAVELYLGTPEQVCARFEHYASLSVQVRRGLRASGIAPVCSENIASPAITTFRLPNAEFADRCLRAGYRIASESNYLRLRNWGQIATMGDITLHELDTLFGVIRNP